MGRFALSCVLPADVSSITIRDDGTEFINLRDDIQAGQSAYVILSLRFQLGWATVQIGHLSLIPQ